MVISELISTIVSVAQKIKAQAELAKANKVRCKRLAERVEALAIAIQGLATKENSDNYIPTLKLLNTCLASCTDLVAKHSGTKSRFAKFKEFVTASDIQKKFEEVTEQLEKTRNDLGLALTANLINRSQDEADAKADRENMQLLFEEVGKQLDAKMLDLQHDFAEVMIHLADIKENVTQQKQQVQDEAEFLYQQGLTYLKTRHFPKAVDCFRSAAVKQHSHAMGHLGLLFLRKSEGGISYNPVEAYFWLRTAAENNYARAMNGLGVMYEDGCGVPPDLVAAQHWYVKAAALGDIQGRKNVARITEKLTLSSSLLDTPEFTRSYLPPSSPVIIFGKTHSTFQSTSSTKDGIPPATLMAKRGTSIFAAVPENKPIIPAKTNNLAQPLPIPGSLPSQSTTYS